MERCGPVEIEVSLWLLLNMIQTPVNKRNILSLYPPVPRKFVSKSQPGFISLKSDLMTMNGLKWFWSQTGWLGYRRYSSCLQDALRNLLSFLLDVMDQQFETINQDDALCHVGKQWFWIQRSLWIRFTAGIDYWSRDIHLSGKVKMPLLQVVHWI